ncbi:MAG: hypothetical protein AWT59_0036 [Candidatus Gallionella acididurans]|uniref:Uncharacterized protein n=1 Tax=Candidatus Gallionella acididurans TaxID=1796491 RepID=A0A139BY42_9PROT|nr:MAG: hypothetical protein AWT59_0036 [Candidatus Gallionella acididurans]
MEHGAITLTQRRIFIIPTKQGFMLGFVLVLMLLGDINYNLSLGYVLTFLLAMMAVMSMLHAFRNLAHLEIRPGRADPVFRGETAQFMLHFNNRSKLSRYQLCLVQPGKSFWTNTNTPLKFDVPAMQDSEVAFPLPATRRGWLQAGRLMLYTEFPLGLFYCWSYLHFGTRCLVYPKPLRVAPLPSGSSPDGTGKRSVAGDEDFSGLRKYTPGDALPRIAWKAYARERGLQVKQFSTPLGEELWLDYADTPDRNEEEKLARMTRWVLDAEAQGLRYGLGLPDGGLPLRHGGAEPSGAGGAAGQLLPQSADFVSNVSQLPSNNGIAHRDECLRRIALFNLPQQGQP